MMTRLLTILVFGLIFPVSAFALSETFTATLSGPGEFPPTTSPGTGTASVTYDASTHMLTVDVTFSGLEAPTTASHIHCCVTAPGAAGVATTVPTFPDFPLGVTSGTYMHTLDLTQASSWNPAFVNANGGTVAGAEAALAAGLNAGDAYLNIHTTMFPLGEISGFLTPEPTTAVLLGAGLAGLTVARNRRNGTRLISTPASTCEAGGGGDPS
jgi:hypothetical protein